MKITRYDVGLIAGITACFIYAKLEQSFLVEVLIGATVFSVFRYFSKKLDN